MDFALTVLGAFVLFFGLSAVFGSFYTVKTAEAAIITRFGQFLRSAPPGLGWKMPYIDRLEGRVSLRVNQIALTMETKTRDNVFVTIPISVQTRVRPEKIFEAYYSLSDPVAQIQSYVEQVAANARGEAEKILVVKKAEAEAESKALQGQGIANQRRAIIEGLSTSIEGFQKALGEATAQDVMQLVLITQYFDTLKSIGESDKTNTLFLSHTPGAVQSISEEIMQSMIAANAPK